MPLSPTALATGFLAPSMLSVGNTGSGVPPMVRGVAAGVTNWLTSQMQVLTVDTGVLGVGTGVAPLLVPPPLIIPAMLTGFASAGLLGISASVTATGLANGLSAGLLALALVRTNHAGVGVGAGVAKFLGPPAKPAILQGLKASGLSGPNLPKLAQAIGTALDIVFAALVMPVPIVGTPTPVSGSGVGIGQIT